MLHLVQESSYKRSKTCQTIADLKRMNKHGEHSIVILLTWSNFLNKLPLK